ncbi:hypothetical protein [Embleya sp. NPDC059237]|uniref:hypothetical protein n=1 Tax=Embleya sp. NPDC059237 TaxID=3346784 RepID=UPI003683ED4B
MAFRSRTTTGTGALLIAATTVLAGLVGTTPAQAASGGTAPACIDRSDVTNIPDGGISGYLYNSCGKTMRVKVIVKHWRDTSCYTIKNKHSQYVHTLGGQYGRTVVC